MFIYFPNKSKIIFPCSPGAEGFPRAGDGSRRQESKHHAEDVSGGQHLQHARSGQGGLHLYRHYPLGVLQGHGWVLQKLFFYNNYFFQFFYKEMILFFYE